MQRDQCGAAAVRAHPDVRVDATGQAPAQLSVDVRVEPSAVAEVRQKTHGPWNPHRRAPDSRPLHPAVPGGSDRE